MKTLKQAYEERSDLLSLISSVDSDLSDMEYNPKSKASNKRLDLLCKKQDELSNQLEEIEDFICEMEAR